MVSIANDIVLYSTGCPKCKVLMKKLDSKGLAYEDNRSVDEMKELGIKSAPVLKVGDELLNFKEAIRWIDRK